MASVLRFRKLYVEPAVRCDVGESVKAVSGVAVPPVEEKKGTRRRGWRRREWNCVDWCCWAIGYMCTAWWVLLLFYDSFHMALPAPESPGMKLKREGLRPLHPVVLVPGIVTAGLELWEGRPCADGLFRKRLWGGASFTDVLRRPFCWLEHISLDNETGMDPPGIRVRPVPGLVAADYFAPGYFVWAVLIENLARIGYEGKNMHMTAYDWRLSFQNTEVRDQSLSRLKSKIELMFRTNGDKKVVVVPHSMGVLYFLHFMKWVEAPPPMGGGGGPGWCAKHIKAIMNIAPAFLGVPKAASTIFSAEAKDVAFVRAMAPGLIDSEILGFQALEHVMRVSRSWDSVMSLLPKGGEAIWGNLDWSPEEGYECDQVKKYLKSFPTKQSSETNSTDGKLGFKVTDSVHYGRIISFSKKSSQLPSSELETMKNKDLARHHGRVQNNASCGVWTEYDEMDRESIRAVAENKVYTAKTFTELLHFVAPKLMQRADAHFSQGLADDLDDPKYSHYKYWSNPLETKLPEAPEMEIYCMYGVGIPTERAYVYKLSPSERCRSIPYRIDGSAEDDKGCLKGGVYSVDGDQSVPALSAGLMCAKGWRGRTRFNPSGIRTYVREYRHKAPANLLEGRGWESGAHVDIMGNVALIEDVMRVAAGAAAAAAADVRSDKIHSDIMRMAERVGLRL
ncbi:hypothetical protein H6P81_007917 [Aristolochia fimbriata]|uniref:phospholipid:diacylglycerol acyltransferase n=1 Tax=Aristolochia fimbriata TaxID=158543 RepID=A0AAV7F634_ARIFI|nr:hypothetical protein H6P81_007917 [Aristolochia fimbriata]